MLQVMLTSVDDTLTAAWRAHCGDLPFVTIRQSSIFDVKADAYVSPANSFGFMDGGIDMAYSQRFGWGVQERLQKVIREKHHGELLIGAAEIVETNADEPRYIIAAPTMRVPMILSNTPNAYLAARAVFLLVKHARLAEPDDLAGERVSDAVKSVAFPGLGTGIGQLDPAVCARQVRAAINEVLLGQDAFPQNWAEASRRHQFMYGDQAYDLQRHPPQAR